MTDQFGTAQIRERVLAGWAAAPVRLREDANAEEDLATGGYRDRLIVELAQNAADAAARAGVPCVLSLTLRERADGPPVLVAANTGEPLTAEGVQSLATLRASAKSNDDGSVGRFGVGFAAVLAVSDEPVVLSRTGGVRFSRDDTAAVVAELGAVTPGLADEVQRRDGHVPVLRLPFAAQGSPPEGFDTAVVLPLRDEAAADLVRQQLTMVDDALLLALPALERVEIDVDGRVSTLANASQRWHVLRRSGSWTDAERLDLLADRPTEERRGRGWQVLWALPRNHSGQVPGVLHAPTPTDEPLSLPALLLAGFPLDPTRRHVVGGPLTDRLVNESADAYADLLAERAAEGADVYSLVPTGLPAGALDGALREAVLVRLPKRLLLRSVEYPGELLRPPDATVLDVGGDHPDVLRVLATVVSGLVAAPRSATAALTALGVQRIALADVVDALPNRGEPQVWHDTYAGLASLADDANAREVLAALPVPLADGRVVRGARGVLLPTDDRLPVEALATLSPYGLRVVHPQAAHPLLGRLGATPATARAVLEQGAAQVAVEAMIDGSLGTGELLELTHAVLSLVSVALQDNSPVPGAWADGELGWLSDLAVAAADGELSPAGGVVLAGSPAAGLLDPDEVGVLDDDMSAAWPRKVLVAVGVLDDLAMVQGHDVDLDDLPDALCDLPDIDSWVEQVGTGVVAQLVAVRDLDLVLAHRWPEAVQHIASRPALRSALVDRVRVSDGDVSRLVPSPTAWWLQRRLGTVGLLDPAAQQGLHGLLELAPPWVAGLDEGIRRALGLVTGLDVASADPDLAAVVLQRLSQADREVDVATCLLAWALLGAAAGAVDIDLPDGVRVIDQARTRVVPAAEAMVPDDPRWLQRGDLGGLVVVAAAQAAALADLLDLPLASELAEGRIDGTGVVADVPGAVGAVLPGAPRQWREHDQLMVDGHEVDWWVEGGDVHAATSDGLARGLAWAAGDWPARHLVAQLLADPGDVVRLMIEDAAGQPRRAPAALPRSRRT